MCESRVWVSFFWSLFLSHLVSRENKGINKGTPCDSFPFSFHHFGNTLTKRKEKKMARRIAITPSDPVSLSTRMASILNQESFSDVTFIVGKEAEKIFGHKAIIASGSPSLKANFEGDWRDRDEITISDIEPKVFLGLLTYIYTNRLEVDSADLYEVLEAADFYLMEPLIKELIDAGHLTVFASESVNYVCHYLSFAVLKGDTELIERCLLVIDNHAKDVLCHPDFLQLSANTILVIVSRNILKVEETVLFTQLVKWSQAECQRKDLSITSEHQRDVMKPFIAKIRFATMSLDDILTVIQPTGILSSDECINILKRIQKLSPEGSSGFDESPRGQIPVV